MTNVKQKKCSCSIIDKKRMQKLYIKESERIGKNEKMTTKKNNK